MLNHKYLYSRDAVPVSLCNAKADSELVLIVHLSPNQVITDILQMQHYKDNWIFFLFLRLLLENKYKTPAGKP